jgi:hypothetical protein
MIGALLGGELRAARFKGQLTVVPTMFFSKVDNVSSRDYGAQFGVGGSFDLHRHLAVTVKFRRAFVSGFEPYSANLSNRTIGVRIQ